MMDQGNVICIFNLDGSGNTTRAKMLANWSRANGTDAVDDRSRFGLILWATENHDAIRAHLTVEHNGSGRVRKVHEKLLLSLRPMGQCITVIFRVIIPIPTIRRRIIAVERFRLRTMVDLNYRFQYPFRKSRQIRQQCTRDSRRGGDNANDVCLLKTRIHDKRNG